MLRTLLQVTVCIGTAILVALTVSILSSIENTRETASVSSEAQATAETPIIDAPAAETVQHAPVVATPRASNQPAAVAQSQESERGPAVRRTLTPYPFDTKSDAELYTLGRDAIVNIYCQSRGSLSSIAGSGVIIDPRGVILTNAHVAQYMLLATDSSMRIECFIRTGSPSKNRFKADILYLSAAWIAEHAEDIAAKRPKGTGEHDYALLLITNTIDGTPLPARFPYLPIDTREAIAFTSDRVLLAGYPAEFAIQNTRGTSILYPASVFTNVGDLFTFGESSVDLISLGGAVLAQSGSSGGAVINLWGHLVAIISTTSDGETTAERELRAITLAYINRNYRENTGESLSSLMANDLNSQATFFMNTDAPVLTAKLTSFLR